MASSCDVAGHQLHCKPHTCEGICCCHLSGCHLAPWLCWLLLQFRKLAELETTEAGTIVDVIGVLDTVEPWAVINKKDGTETRKRSLTIRDDSGRSVEVSGVGSGAGAYFPFSAAQAVSAPPPLIACAGQPWLQGHIHWCAQAALGAKVWVVVLTHSRKRGSCIRSCCVAATSLGGVTSSSLQSPTNPVSVCVC